MRDLVVISLEVWDEVWRRNQHLVAGLLRSGRVDRVLFIEPPVDFLHQLRRGQRLSTLRLGLRRVHLDGLGDRLWAYRPAKLLPRRLDPGGDQRRARIVEGAARRLGMKSPVLWINDPGGVEVMRGTGWPSIYDITDDWLSADRSARELERLHSQEEALLREAREVVVCSEHLQRTKSTQRQVRLIPNAVDLAAFQRPVQRPPDLPDGPVAMYVGTVHRDRMDVDLCVEVAARLGAVGASLALIGPHPLPESDLLALKDAGALLLGPRPSEAVPSYLKSAAVLLVPHVITPFTLSLDPIKAYEYRAASRPVVATPVPGFVDAGDPCVVIARRESFSDTVLALLKTDCSAGHGTRPTTPSWVDRASDMADVIATVYE